MSRAVCAAMRLDAQTMAPTLQRVLLDAEPLRVPVGADDVGNDTERTASVTGALTRVHEHGGERAGRIGMSAVAEDDVEHDHRRAAVTGRVDDRGVSKARVDDRVRSPARVLLSAEVDEPVDTATNQATRFFAQGASGI